MTKEDLDLVNPKFGQAGKIHDWRNYVPIIYKNKWDDLTVSERQIIFVMSSNQADNEEWN